MKKVDDLKTGEKFRLGDREFVIEEERKGYCKGCFFEENDIPCEELKIYSILPQCNGDCRKDKTNVIFKEVAYD